MAELGRMSIANQFLYTFLSKLPHSICKLDHFIIVLYFCNGLEGSNLQTFICKSFQCCTFASEQKPIL
jgi:hypothetical protein